MSKNDWDAALDEWVAEERERLGGPPEPEEVVAFLRGELPEADAARIQALLIYYPELTALLTEKIVRGRMNIRWFSVAASLLLATFLIHARVQIADMNRERNEPHMIAVKHELRSVMMRGGQTKSQPYVLPDEDRYALAPVLSAPPRDPAYRIEIIALSGEMPRRVWISPLAQPPFEVDVPRAFFRDGVYQLNVIGVDGAHTRLVEQFRFRTPQSRGGGIFSTK